MASFSIKWLKENSVDGTLNELRAMSAILENELEMRVGTLIAKQLSDEQIEEFERLLDETDEADIGDMRLAWLEQAMPNYKQIVHQQKDRLITQIQLTSNKAAFITDLQKPAE
jgi:hypothetical protein